LRLIALQHERERRLSVGLRGGILEGCDSIGAVENALYYTFSTIAQALAAAIALLAAFAMYRLKGIDDESSGAAIMIESATGGGAPLRQYSLVSHWSKCVEAADRRILDARAGPEVVALRNQLVQLRIAARGVRRAMWIALAATAVVMAGSVEVLAYVPALVQTGLARKALGWGVFGFAACLLTYCWLIWQSFRVSRE
jgi:hypothetical protein